MTEAVTTVVNTTTNQFIDLVKKFFNKDFFTFIARVFNVIFYGMPFPVVFLLGFYVLVMSIRFTIRLVEFVMEVIPFT